MFTVGIDIGASSVKVVALQAGDVSCLANQQNPFPLLWAQRRVHKGSASACLLDLLSALTDDLPIDECVGWALTGSGADAFMGHGVAIPFLEEVPALTLGVRMLHPEAASVIAIGGQRAAYVTDLTGEAPPRFGTNESCAAGTGSFFEDQMSRLNLSIEDYSSHAQRATSLPRLSGRCAVFAKTDIIHRQQEGVAVDDILLGLCFAAVKSFKASIVRGMPVAKPVVLAGGVLLNSGVVRAVREVFGLDAHELLCGQENLYLQAVGAALHAARCAGFFGKSNSLTASTDTSTSSSTTGSATSSLPDIDVLLTLLHDCSAYDTLARREPLPDTGFKPTAGYQLRSRPWPVDEDGRTPCALGIDVGSTSTDLVLLDAEGGILDAQYLRTAGNPKQAVRDGLSSLASRLGNTVRVDAVGVTGSGRTMIGEFVGADAVRDEITAQARAAVAADPSVDTVFEIGGQDSKLIVIDNGQVVDFQMNKICAAGTGSFVEEQAARLDIPLAEYGDLALSSKSPVELGDRCTVFVETAIATALSQGAAKADIAAGLCQSIVSNYLNRVVSTKRVGKRIALAGGVAYNKGIVAAFKQRYGENLFVTPWYAVSGAVGAALLAYEAQGQAVGHVMGQAVGQAQNQAQKVAKRPETNFRGFDLTGTTKQSRHVDLAEVERNRAFFGKSQEFYLEGYNPTIDPNKKTVGVPRALLLYKFFPLANAFFRTLGYNVILSDVSDEETVRLSQQTARGETCYPVKLIHGHMAQLADAGIDYLFMPRVHTVKHGAVKVEHNYGCPYMQVAPLLVARDLGLEERGIQLIAPELDLDLGQQAMASAMMGVGVQLGHDPHETAKALLAGGFAVNEFSCKVEELGSQLIDSLEPNERVLVIVTRNYGIEDAVLNMGIPDLLLDRGQKVITVSHLEGGHDCDISRDYPCVCWPFGQHLLTAMKIIRRDPRLFAVYLTNHGCGPDTMLTHLMAEEMKGKPYLQIEVDEHFSKVGVITRIEAFLNSLDHYQAQEADRTLPFSPKQVTAQVEPLDPRKVIGLPSFGPAGPLLGRWFENQGYQVSLLEPSPAAIARGRQEMTTKEYLSFTALVGVGLRAAEQYAAEQHADGVHSDGEQVLDKHSVKLQVDKQEAAGSNRAEQEVADKHAIKQAALPTSSTGFQLLIPSTEGAEADNLYERVLISKLAAYGLADTEIISPKLEQLPARLGARLESFFAVLVANDVVLATPPDKRADIQAALLEDCSFEAVLSQAQRVSYARAGQADKPSVLVVGEWPCVLSDHLSGGMWRKLEGEGYTLRRMPIAEFFWFMWRDVLEGVARDDARWAALDRLANLMRQISCALGSASPFCDDVESLCAEADKLMGRFRGANGRYRAAKACMPPASVQGVLATSSLYENTDIILKLFSDSWELPVPILHVNFDAALDQGIEERIRSFLYYLQPTVPATSEQPANESLVSEVSCG